MSDEGKETVAKLADDEGFESVFSLRKPKDAKAGFSSGVKNIAKGVVGGAVGLVAAPAVGAMDEGWKGFGKGLAAGAGNYWLASRVSNGLRSLGVAGAVILPAAGVVTGAAQIAKGVANQPEAIRQQKQGRVWDPQLREWIDKPTNALATDDQIFKDSRDRWDADRRQGTFSSTTDYYEMLEVPKDATPDQIKKQYYLLARKYHPDKNPDNAEAKLRFQQLAEAYQVLADPEMRSQYDAHGKAGVDTGELKEAAEFFTLLFGSDRLEPLVGELLIAFSARSGNNVQRAEIEKFQEARQAQLAENLLRLLHPYEEMLEEEFREMIKVKAQYWVQVEGSYGYRMLRVIAKLYRLQANIHGGNLLESVGSRLQQGGSNFKSHLHAANTLVKALAHNEQMERQARKAAAASNADSAAPADDGGAAAREGATSTSAKAPTIDPMLAHEMQEKGRVLLLEVMWAGNVLDIENTVKGVCQRVLRDPSASKARLKRRAAGLQILGDILLEAAKQQEGLLEAEGKKSTKAAIAQDDMEQVARRMLEKRLAEDDAKYSTAAPASPPAAGP